MNSSLKVTRAALKTVADRYGLDLIVLFGSRAKGRAVAQSDMDVAVLLGPAARRRLDRRPPVWELDIAGELADALGGSHEVDFVCLNRASPLLQFAVARHGIVLYKRRPGAFSRFRLYAARQFDDHRKYYEAMARYVRRRTG
jgi:predicted nucleotidyltransferase